MMQLSWHQQAVSVTASPGARVRVVLDDLHEHLLVQLHRTNHLHPDITTTTIIIISISISISISIIMHPVGGRYDRLAGFCQEFVS